MEPPSGPSPRLNYNKLPKQISDPHPFESELTDLITTHHLQSTSALEILRETVGILRYNLTGFMVITAVLIFPVSTVLLSNVLVDQSIVKRLTIRLLLIAKSSGIPLWPFIKQSCQKFSETAVAATMCFPLYITLLLLSKVAVVYSVDCTYSRKKFDTSKFYVIVSKIWRRVVFTYFWVCTVLVGCLTLFLAVLVIVGSLFSILGLGSDWIMYAVIVVGMFFSVFLANAIIICNLAMVISVLEDVSGPQALLRSSLLIRGQTQVGLLIFLMSTFGMAFVEGLFEHRVKTLSYGNGSSRIWEGPLLVLMYSFLVLIDFMMSTVFYFSCKLYNMDLAKGECQPVLEALAISIESAEVDSTVL